MKNYSYYSYKPKSRLFDGVTGISYRHNSHGSTMTMRSNYALKEMSNRNTPWW